MRVEPAHIDQLRRGKDGRVHVITADAGGVAEELARIHPGLKLRYNELGEYFAVYYESEDARETYLILTAKECDHRITDRLKEIDKEGRSGYDYAKALEEGSREAKERVHAAFRERMQDAGELAAHAIRKDLGVRYRGRAFIPRSIA